MGHKHQLYTAKQFACSLPAAGKIELASLLLATLEPHERDEALSNVSRINFAAEVGSIRRAIARGEKRSEPERRERAAMGAPSTAGVSQE